MKLLAVAEFDGPRVRARVTPAFIPKAHPFASVRHEYNAVTIHGDAVGDVMFYGKGAGALAAASAVVSDVVYLARQVASGTAGIVPYVTYDAHLRLEPQTMEAKPLRHYLRINTFDKPGALAQLATVLARHHISIAEVDQEDPGEVVAPRRGVPVVVVTHQAPDGAVRRALAEINKLAVVARRAVHLRIEDL
jgi:homoserine dehydrogenase